MKLLFVGPLLDFSGFAHAARLVLRSLIGSDIDLVARPLCYDQLDAGQKFVPEPWLAELFQKDLQGVDMVIQVTTCNSEAIPVPGVVNALYTFFESDRLQRSWAEKANQFDFIIVPSRHNVQALVNSGVTRPVMACPVPCDSARYERDVKPFEIRDVGNRTVFYNICQLSTKKGIDALLRAYYAAFCDMPNEVLLVLKTYINMHNREGDLNMVKSYIQQVKAKTRIPIENWPPVMPIVYTMTDDEIDGLHTRGDAYVCSSRAEGWGIPPFDAMAFGKTVISNNYGGLGEFVKEETALIYGGMATLFFDVPHPDPGLFTGVEQCFEPSPAHMAALMRRFHLLRKGAMTNQLDETNLKEWEAVLQRRNNGKMMLKGLDYRNLQQHLVPKLKIAYETWRASGQARFERNVIENREVPTEAQPASNG
jgi:glycosyltransferase involved in cell wall biosynthesis